MNHLIEFQKNNGLEPDGIIGPKTIEKMRAVFGIKTRAQLAHFLANVHHETGGFIADTENLNYTAVALAATWPKRYKDPATGKPNALAVSLAKKPQKIANNVYVDRMGNGDEASGDGWKFRGRGALQLTGKGNYERFAAFVNDPSVVSNPDIVAQKYFWESALFYFTTGNLWNQMKYSDDAAVKAVRKAVNGGYIGLDDVQKKFEYYFNLIVK